MPLSAASVLHATSLALLLLLLLHGATANGDVSTPTATNAMVTPGGDTDRYICYLCAGRNPMLMRYCPIYWDECHLVCYDPVATSAAALPSPVSADPRAVYGNNECYVMKLYSNGSYVIVDRLDCSGVAWCLLTCGGGDLDDDRKALGAMTPVRPPALRGVLPDDFERCGTQVADQAAPASFPGVVRH
ncbi:hypothetical protein EJB05_07415, partial [Eragrostis curvula]